MSSHLEISNFIKCVHEELRDNSKVLGFQKAWQEHCADTKKLEKYALAMKELATNHWENPNKSNSSDLSRIYWIYQACINYFSSEFIDKRKKELVIASKVEKDLKISTSNFSTKLKLLDVGSCYNPFKEYKLFDVTALDIAPAVEDVFRCDFLNVELNESIEYKNSEVKVLPVNHFDVVVFSLFLEYLPSPLLRKNSCIKAYKLLKPEGILVIVTPDSNHVGSNAKYIKSWRFVLANIGFSRVKYEKLKHIHCMVFRKSINPNISMRWADIHKKEQTFDEMHIPQDFKINAKPQTNFNNIAYNCEDIKLMSQELPFLTYDD